MAATARVTEGAEAATAIEEVGTELGGAGTEVDEAEIETEAPIAVATKVESIEIGMTDGTVTMIETVTGTVTETETELETDTETHSEPLLRW